MGVFLKAALRAALLLLVPTLAGAAPYALVNSSNIVINIVNWDGVTPFTPPAGDTLVATLGNPNAQIGGTFIGGVFTPPATSTPQGIIDLLVPTTGQTIAIPPAPQPQAKLYLILEPAAALATLTVQLPLAPQDGDDLYIFSTKLITTLTVTAPGGQSLVLMPTTLTAGAGVHIVFSLQFQTYLRVPSG